MSKWLNISETTTTYKMPIENMEEEGLAKECIRRQKT